MRICLTLGRLLSFLEIGPGSSNSSLQCIYIYQGIQNAIFVTHTCWQPWKGPTDWVVSMILAVKREFWTDRQHLREPDSGALDLDPPNTMYYQSVLWCHCLLLWHQLEGGQITRRRLECGKIARRWKANVLQPGWRTFLPSCHQHCATLVAWWHHQAALFELPSILHLWHMFAIFRNI